MKRLGYETLRESGYGGYLLQEAPERVLQFGEGNFLRAFVDYFIDVMNEKAGFNAKVAVVQPIAAGLAQEINAQQGLYTLLLRGRENGGAVSRRRVISCISRCIDPYRAYGDLLGCAKNPALRFIVSNTTEAGIAFDEGCRPDDTPPASFPAKLTRFLYERYRAGLGGFVVLSCELIDHNGQALRACVERYISLWGLGEGFGRWVATENLFCSTLVDRIVTGYPAAEAAGLWRELGYEDRLLDTGETFGLWVIEGPKALEAEFPAKRAGLPVEVVRDHTPFKQRKVRILNGAHAALVPGAYLAGQDIVRGCMEDGVCRAFLEKAVYDEILPTLDLPQDELRDFAAAVAGRFENPYIDHRLLDIALNATAKWRARVLPSLLGYFARTGKLPACLTFSLAATICFYHGGRERGAGCLLGRRGDACYQVRDEGWVLDFYYNLREADDAALVEAVVHNKRMWGGALEGLPGIERALLCHLGRIRALGMRAAMGACVKGGLEA